MGFNKDELHAERKRIENDLREGGIFSKDKMHQMDCKTKDDESRRVKDYVKWQESRGRDGRTNKQKMDRWAEINREFKKHGEEGRVHTIDDVRERKSVRYD